jgi:hypothetical protein
MGILINSLINNPQRRRVMRKVQYTVLLLLVMVLCIPSAWGQITVPKDKLNALATALSTAPAGSVLLLERGGLYPNVGVVTVTVPVTLQATGTGKRPVVFQTAKTDGTYDVRDFQLNGASFTAIGIHFDADHGDNSWTRYGLSSGVANIVLRFDGCAFSNYFGRTIDLLTADNKAFFTDCIWAGDVKRTGFDEGRPIDARQFGHDTVFVQNCTFQNVTDRFFRHYTGAGYTPLDVVIFDHCTFAYGYNYRPGFQFGTIKNLQFTNNLVIDPGMMGTEPFTIRKNEVDYPEGDIRVFSAVKVDSLQTKINMSNNNVYIEQPILDIFKANKDSISQAPWFNAEFKSKIDTNKAVFSEVLTFANVPGAPTTVISQFARSPRTPITATAMNLRHPDSVNYAYSTSSKSYTAAAGGFPVGDLNWFPTRKAAWITAGKPITAVEQQTVAPRTFTLSQNYPNPFNPSTTINYSLATDSHVMLAVYDVLGREVARLVDDMRQAGIAHRVTFDASRLASGVYYYRLQAGASSIVNKMILTK